MSKDDDDDGKYKGHFDVPPKPKGGRRSKVSAASLKNLRPWKPGQSGNPAGQPKAVVELNKAVRAMLPAVYEEMERIVHDPEASNRDKVAAAVLLDARGCGRPAIGVFHGTTGGTGGLPPGHLPEGEDGAPSALLLRAARESGGEERIIAELKAEIRRRENKLASDKEEREARLADTAAAIANGEEVSGLSRLLLQAREERAKRH